MIRLSKADIPDVLRAKANAWTEALLEKLSAGGTIESIDRERYRHVEIKEALKVETNRKCAYCESHMLHVSYGDIEHIVPKSREPSLMYEWTNLTLACSVCNTCKGAYAGSDGSLVDPYFDQPDEHLHFEGPIILPAPGSAKGFVTEPTFKLNRPDLFERRVARLKRLNTLLDLIARETNADARRVMLNDLQNERADDVEYAGMCRAYLDRRSAHLSLDAGSSG